MDISVLIGKRLKRELVNDAGLVFIPKHTILLPKHISYMETHGMKVSEDDVEPVPHKVQASEALVVHATEEIRDVFHRMRTNEKIPMDDVTESIIPAIHHASDFPDLYSVLSGLHAKDDYTYRHNIGVGVIATMIGKWLRLDKDELAVLTTAATLHDLGKVRISDDILNKPGKFSDDEYDIMKRHTVYGYELIKQTADIDPRIGLVALQHHEREDGRGYPHGIKGEDIQFFSKIVGVADIFHAMTSERVYKKAMPFYQVMQQMVEEGFGKLDPAICNLFVRRMMEMAIGGEVLLSNGETGKIVIVHSENPINPAVIVGDRYYDLRQHAELHIERLVG